MFSLSIAENFIPKVSDHICNLLDLNQFATPDKTRPGTSKDIFTTSSPIPIVNISGEIASYASVSVLSDKSANLSNLSDFSDKKLVVIKHLPAKLVNCKKLFSFLWQYGNMDKIVFDQIEGEEGLTAYVVTPGIHHAERFVINLEACKLFGVKVNSHILPMNEDLLSGKVFELDDGSYSERSFLNHIVCESTDQSIPPTRTLRFLHFVEL